MAVFTGGTNMSSWAKLLSDMDIKRKTILAEKGDRTDGDIRRGSYEKGYSTDMDAKRKAMGEKGHLTDMDIKRRRK